MLERAHERLKKAGEGGVLGVTYQDAPTDSRAFVEEHDVRYPIVRDVGTNLAEAYGTGRLPETFVLDRRGRIVDLRRGQVDQAWTDRVLDEALGA